MAQVTTLLVSPPSVLVARVDLGAGADLVSASANVTGATLLGGALTTPFPSVALVSQVLESWLVLVMTLLSSTKTSLPLRSLVVLVTTASTSTSVVKLKPVTTTKRRWVQQHLLRIGAGLDTLSFANVSTYSGQVDLTIAVDESFGKAATVKFNSSTSLISIGTGASIFVSGLTGIATMETKLSLTWASRSQLLPLRLSPTSADNL